MKKLDEAIKMCDSDYVVSVKEASDRDASKAISIAQNLGFETNDRGYTIVLRKGDDKMLAKFKHEIAGMKGVKVL